MSETSSSPRRSPRRSVASASGGSAVASANSGSGVSDSVGDDTTQPRLNVFSKVGEIFNDDGIVVFEKPDRL